MQVAALEAAQDVDTVAARIGAANTLVRQRDGSLKAYNTDWSAAIGAVEAGLGGGPSSSSAPLPAAKPFALLAQLWEELSSDAEQVLETCRVSSCHACQNMSLC